MSTEPASDTEIPQADREPAAQPEVTSTPQDNAEKPVADIPPALRSFPDYPE